MRFSLKNKLSAIIMMSSILIGHQTMAGDLGLQQDDDTKPTIPMGTPQKGGFVITGGSPGQWSFILGPIGFENISLKMLKANPDKSGAVGFFCTQKTGDRQLAIALPNGRYTKNITQDFIVTVGNRTAKLPMTVETDPPKGEPPVFIANGQAVADILSTMGQVSDSLITANLSFDDGYNHRVAFGLTNPRDVAIKAYQICDGWAKIVKQQEVAKDNLSKPNAARPSPDGPRTTQQLSPNQTGPAQTGPGQTGNGPMEQNTPQFGGVHIVN